jgi:hypothetical protein
MRRWTGAERTSSSRACSGWHKLDGSNVPLGAPLSVTQVPAWGTSTPAGESAVLAHLRF